MLPEEDATDHYATLGLDRRCTAAQIRQAYRILAKRYHPDVNRSNDQAAEQCRRLNAAHEVLSDPFRRRDYDRELEREERTASSTTSGPKPRAAKVERHVRQDAFLRLVDFLRGTHLDIRVHDPANPAGPEQYSFEIPAGTAPGARFRIPRTEPVPGGEVHLRVKPMPGGRLKVRGSDVQGELRISSRRAQDGGSESIQGVNGLPVRVQIPSGIKRGEIIRCIGEGLPKAHGGRGDLLVKVVYKVEVRVTRAGG